MSDVVIDRIERWLQAAGYDPEIRSHLCQNLQDRVQTLCQGILLEDGRDAAEHSPLDSLTYSTP